MHAKLWKHVKAHTNTTIPPRIVTHPKSIQYQWSSRLLHHSPYVGICVKPASWNHTLCFWKDHLLTAINHLESINHCLHQHMIPHKVSPKRCENTPDISQIHQKMISHLCHVKSVSSVQQRPDTYMTFKSAASALPKYAHSILNYHIGIFPQSHLGKAFILFITEGSHPLSIYEKLWWNHTSLRSSSIRCHLPIWAMTNFP